MLRALRRQHLQNLQSSIPPLATPTREDKEKKTKKRKKVVRSSSVPPQSGKKRDPEALRGEVLQKEAVALARAVMRTADTNKNKAPSPAQRVIAEPLHMP